jgi:hypothetical protein
MCARDEFLGWESVPMGSVRAFSLEHAPSAAMHTSRLASGLKFPEKNVSIGLELLQWWT